MRRSRPRGRPSPTRERPPLARRLRERRLALGLTRQQVAERLGASSQRVHEYETGANCISAGRLHRLAEALETELGHFFAGLEPAAGARPASTERERALLLLARDFTRLPGRGHREALCLLARALADAQIG